MAISEEEKLYRIALSQTKGVGNLHFRQLISHFGSAQEAFDALPSKIQKIPQLGQKVIAEIKRGEPLKNAESLINTHRNKGIEVVVYGEDDYPYRIKQIPDAPTVLFMQGNKAAYTNKKVIGIVGSRKATTEGRDNTNELVKVLAPYQPCIVSGLAYGIDIAAHKSALEYELETIAVLAGGLDQIYPAQHKPIVKQLLEKEGAILSEQAFGVKPKSEMFPARNRILAALCDAVVIVEATEKGGSLITANLANDYDREVYAVPGSWNNSNYAGCLNLIATNKAYCLPSANALPELLNWENGVALKATVNWWEKETFTENEKKIIDALLEKDSIHLDALSWQTEISISSLAILLIEMEMKGWIKGLPGKAFKINHLSQ